MNTPEARRKRLFNQRAGTEHEGMHLGSRSELDKAGFHAFTAPREMWTVMADAATQRNFMIPKFKFRVPKKLNGPAVLELQAHGNLCLRVRFHTVSGA